MRRLGNRKSVLKTLLGLISFAVVTNLLLLCCWNRSKASTGISEHSSTSPGFERPYIARSSSLHHQQPKQRQQQQLNSTSATIHNNTARARTQPKVEQPHIITLSTFLRYDEAGLEYLQPIPGSARSHALPNAVPFFRTIPRHLAEKKPYHMMRRTNTTSNSIMGVRGHRKPYYKNGGGGYDWEHHSYSTDHRGLYMYNPSILALYKNADDDGAVNTKKKDPDVLTDAALNALTGGDQHVKYLATFRVNLGGNCFGPELSRKLMLRGEQISYLAVALLDSELDVVDGSDVLIDLNILAGDDYHKQSVEDCKALILQKGLYLLCNSHLMRVEIVRRGAYNSTSTIDNTTTIINTGQRDIDKRPYRCQNIYGNGLDVILWSATVIGGKNQNFFRSVHPNQATGLYDYYQQFFPLPHAHYKVEIPSADESPLTRTPKQMAAEYISNTTLPPATFLGPDSSYYIETCPENDLVQGKKKWVNNCSHPIRSPFFPNHDHGTACCLRMKLHNHQDVLVGISHAKTSPIQDPRWSRDVRGFYKNKNIGKRYLSRWIAYNASWPFDIVARSGFFCLGFANESESGGNTLASKNSIQMDLLDATYNCPAIHFVSGLSEYVGDASKVVLGYGINDCYPRIIVVDKRQIIRLLGG